MNRLFSHKAARMVPAGLVGRGIDGRSLDISRRINIVLPDHRRSGRHLPHVFIIGSCNEDHARSLHLRGKYYVKMYRRKLYKTTSEFAVFLWRKHINRWLKIFGGALKVRLFAPAISQRPPWRRESRRRCRKQLTWPERKREREREREARESEQES